MILYSINDKRSPTGLWRNFFIGYEKKYSNKNEKLIMKR